MYQLFINLGILDFCVMQLGVPGQTPSKSGPLRKVSL